MADDFAKLPTPKEMPPQVIQRIKDLKCPPPIRASKFSARINVLNAEMQKQADEIKILENQIEDLEKRYKISFSCENNPKFDLQSRDIPRIDLSGNLTNLILDFHIWQARAGIGGVQGDQGDQGKRGLNAEQGPPGIPGYYGIRGDMK
jgi:hypothetical protein